MFANRQGDSNPLVTLLLGDCHPMLISLQGTSLESTISSYIKQIDFVISSEIIYRKCSDERHISRFRFGRIMFANESNSYI